MANSDLVPTSYNYVDGETLTGLILEVRDQFASRAPYDPGDGRRPNSVQAVALDVFVARPIDERLLVLRDLLDRNDGLTLTRAPHEVFAYADAAGTYLTDLVCEVVREVLLRDASIREEDARRVALAEEAFGEAERREDDGA